MKFFVKCLLGLVTIAFSATAKTEDVRPNVLVFLVDDMGVMDTSLPFLVDEQGNPVKHELNRKFRTPAMEALGGQSLRFSRFHAHSVCSPSRISLVTGQGSARHRTTTWVNPFKQNPGPEGWNWVGPGKDSVTLPRLLQSNGYRTIHCGKAHFGPVGRDGEDPKAIGFDVNIAGCSWGQPGSYYGKRNYGEGGSHAVPGLEKYHGTKTFLTEALTLEMKDAISSSVADGEPFFAHMSHYALHAPFESDPRFAGNYEQSGWPKRAQAFATLVEGMDKSLGDLMAHLNDLGVAEETLVVFLGDNGTDLPVGGPKAIACAAPLRGKKGSCYEGGTRAPLIIGWAKANPDNPVQKRFALRQGVEGDTLVTVNDLFPTVLEVAGVDAPKGHVVDGESLVGLMQSGESGEPREFLMHFPHNHRSSWFTSLHQGEWKLIYHYKRPAGERVELFNLSQDPSESRNLAEADPGRVRSMIARMLKLLDESDALFAIDSETGELMRPVLPVAES